MLFSTVIQIIFLFCWGAFFLTWVGGALYNFLKRSKSLRQGRSSGWLLIGILLVEFAITSALWSTLAANAPELQIIGTILLIVATLFALWSRLVLGTMWSSGAAVKSAHQLRTDGPYRITRHPIYTGILGMLAGTTLISVGSWPILLIGLVVILRRIPNEEQLMAEQFGEQYVEDKNRVPQLVPGPYPRRRRK